MFAAKAAPTLRGFDKTSCRSGLAREFGVGSCALQGSRPRPLLRSAASIKHLVGAGLPANSAFDLTLWKVRGQGRSYAPRLRLNSCRSGLAREFGVRSYALQGSRPRPLLRSAASIKHLVGAGLPANSAFDLALWKVRGQGRSYAPRLRLNSCRSGLAREFGVRSCALECSRPRPFSHI